MGQERKNGHRLVFASGHPNSEKMQRLIAEAAPNARCGSDADAAKSSEVVLVSTPWDAAQEALQSAGDLSGSGHGPRYGRGPDLSIGKRRTEDQ